jgi:hypothetical protein
MKIIYAFFLSLSITFLNCLNVYAQKDDLLIFDNGNLHVHLGSGITVTAFPPVYGQNTTFLTPSAGVKAVVGVENKVADRFNSTDQKTKENTRFRYPDKINFEENGRNAGMYRTQSFMGSRFFLLFYNGLQTNYNTLIQIW